jgi:hypothetical protein
MITSGRSTVDQIRERAYELWQADGCPEGRELDYWLRAEADLNGEAGVVAPIGLSEAAPSAMDEPAAERPARPRTTRAKAAPVPAPPPKMAPEKAKEPVAPKRARRKTES